MTLYWNIFATIIVVCAFSIFVGYLHLRRRVREAKNFLQNREAAFGNVGSDAPNTGEIPALDGTLRSAMQRYEYTFYGTVQRRILPQFSVEEAANPVRRAAAGASAWLRPFSGWFLLLGLIITLVNLQSAVGTLSGAFRDVSVTASSANSSSPAQRSVSARERERNVTDKMANMAGAASRAFLTSLCFIVLALACMVLAVIVDRRAKHVLIRFEKWANDLYQHYLPGQLPITEGDVAKNLAETVSAMQLVASELQSASSQLTNLGPLVATMGGATDAIQEAMRQLPRDLQSSMSTVTSDLVKGLTSTLGESNEYTKRILAIYAEQELRVRGLDSVLKAVQSSLKEIKESHQLLASLPDQQSKIAASADGVHRSLELVGRSTDRIASMVERLPVLELTQAVDAILNTSLSLEEIKTRVLDSNGKVLSAIEAHIGGDMTVRAHLEELSRYLLKLNSLMDGNSHAAKQAYAESIKQLVLEKLANTQSLTADATVKDLLLQIAAQIRAIRVEADIALPSNGATA